MTRLLRAAMVAALFALLAAPTQAADLSGDCTLLLRSYDANGNLLDDASGQGGLAASDLGTTSNPFRVDWNGRLDYLLSTGDAVFGNYSWQVNAEGVPVPVFQGSTGDPLPQEQRGAVEISPDLTQMMRVAGVVYLSASVTGNGGTTACQGGAWIRFVGNPFGTLPFWVMVGLLLFGVILLIATPYTVSWDESLYAPRPIRVVHRHWIRGIIGGLLVGIGLALATIIYGLNGIGAMTPWAAILVGLAIGIILALMPSIRGGRRKPRDFYEYATYGSIPR